jgi:raffinose/stachyose/melibiose transport system substrate-binding protein
LLQGGIQKMMAGTITPVQLGTDMTQGIARYYGPFKGK